MSSSLGKSFHTVYRRRLMPYIYQTATSLQYTSQRSPHVTQASHTVRSFLDYQCHKGRSAFVIFGGIKEAFYRLIRQNAINATCSDEDVMKFLNRMDVQLHIDQVAQLMSQKPAIDGLGTRPHLSRMVTEIHSSMTWRSSMATIGMEFRELLPAAGPMMYIRVLWHGPMMSFGMTPNMGPGKTEAIATPRRRHVLKVRRELFNQQKGLLPLSTSLEDQVFLRLAPRYKHLGSYIVHGAHNRPEILHRLAQGHQSLKDYRNKLHNNPMAPLKRS